MLKLATPLLLTIINGTILCGQQTGEGTYLNSQGIPLTGIQIDNLIFNDLSANVEFCDSLFVESKLMRLSLNNCDKTVKEYKLMGEAKTNMIADNMVEVSELKKEIRKKNFLISVLKASSFILFGLSVALLVI